MVEMIAGDPHAAIPPLRAAFGGLGALGVGADAGTAAALLARALLVDGQVDEADEMASSSEHLSGQNLQTAIGWRVARAEVLAARGNLGAAVTVAGEAVEIPAGTDLNIDHPDACVALAPFRAQPGDTAGAHAARAAARRLYEQKGATVPAARLDEAEPTVAAVEASPTIAEPAEGRENAAERLPGRATGTRSSDERAGEGAVIDGAWRSGSAVENVASRVYARTMAAIAGRDDDRLDELVAPAFRYDDRRHVVNYGVSGLEGAAEQIAWLRQQGFEMPVPEVVAVRGDRVALCWNDTRTPAGDDISSLSVVAVDERGRLDLLVQFDEDAQRDAFETLDARYTAAEAAGHADLVRLVSSWIGVFEDGDVEKIRDLVGPDFVWVDHQRLGWGTLDVDEIVELFRALGGLQNDVIVSREVVVGNGILFSAANHATDAEGGEVLWSFHAVGLADEAGRTTRVEIFGEDDLAGALARLDELSHGDGGRPPLENTASRVDARVIELLAAGADRELAELTAPGLHFEDRRHVVNFGAITIPGLVAQIEWLREEGFEVETPRVVAVRGDRLVLGRRTRRTPSGDAMTSLGVVEVDEQGRLLAVIQFDDEDIDEAVAELESRYAAGEGSAHAEVPQGAARVQRVFDEAPDPLGEPVGPAVPTVAGPTNLAARRWMELIGCIAGGDRDAVRARISGAFVGLDRRPLVAGPDADADSFLDGALGAAEVFDDIAPEAIIAVRGDRYVLLRGRFASDGFVVPILSLNEVDADGLATRTVVLDDTDLPTAVYELDQRYLVGEGAEHAWIGGPGAEFWRCYNERDWAGARRHLADEMVVVDHRQLGSGTTLQSADQLIEYVEAMVELVPDLIAFDVEHPRIGRRGALSRHLATGTSSDGAAVELETLVITGMRDGRFVRSETFAPDRLDAAIARFDELEAAERT
jgi:hypothetical protein